MKINTDEYSGTFINGSLFTPTNAWRIGGRSTSHFHKGVIRNVTIYDTFDLSGKLAQYAGDGNTNAARLDQQGPYHGTVSGSPEQCLVHRRGAVIRGVAEGNRYV